MNRMEIEEEINDLRFKLKENLQLFFENAIINISITREQMKKLSKEFDIPLNAQFRENLKSKFVELIFNLQKQHWIVKCLRYPPTNMEELINTSFFPSEELPVLERHPPLSEFISLVNSKISEFYELQKKLIQYLMQQYSKLEQNEKNQIEKKKALSQPQKEVHPEQIRKKSSDSLIEISQEDEVNQFYEDQKKKNYLNVNRKRQERLNKNRPAIRKDQNVVIDLLKLSNYTEPSQDAQQCKFCLCYKLSLTKVIGQMIKCVVCTHYFHTQCLQIENKIPQVFACPECIIPRLDHLRPLEDVLLVPQYVNLRQNYNKIYDLEPIPIKNTDQYEMRCMKIDGENQEIAWPDCGELKVNGISVLQFIPLEVNSCLKKRKDENQPLKLLPNFRNQINFKQGLPTKEQMKQFRIKLGQTFLISIFKVYDRTKKQFVEEIKKEEGNWMGIEQCKQMIKLSIMSNQNENFAIEKIKISLNDVLNMSLIETPVRGTFCTHIQCFSLENMCTMMKNMTLRKWRCPICKSLILGFVVDSYQLCILSLIKQYNLNIDEISFNSEAKIEPEKIQELYLSYCQTIFPPFMYSNTNRSIAVEILSQRMLGLSNVFGSLQEVDIESPKQEEEQIRNTEFNVVLPSTKEGTQDQPICLD